MKDGMKGEASSSARSRIELSFSVSFYAFLEMGLVLALVRAGTPPCLFCTQV